jgi:polyisoprenyl-teichoic acid--peptidoglycan teichoic acid transferase
MNAENVNFLKTHKPLYETEPRKPRWFLFLLILLGVLIIGGCITRAIVGEYAPNDPDKYDPVTLEPKSPDGFLKKITYFVFNKENQLEGYKDDRINLLLLGMGGLGHDGPFLTDTIIIASIQPSTGKIAMISIPRDLGVKIPGHGWYKINHAGAFGEAEESDNGAKFAAEVIEKTFDIDIHYFSRVDFMAFEEIIDEVGGLKINIANSFVDHMYPADNYEYQTIEFFKGVQTMDGDTALKFVRSRHGNNGEGSDFARARRQQKIIFALKEKLLSFETLVNPIKINNIRKSLEKHITTNLDFSEIMSLVRLARELNTGEVVTVVLDDSPQNYLKNGYSSNGAFILEPKDGNFDKINDMIKNIFVNGETKRDDTPTQPEPKIDYSGINIEIQNGTWTAGMAARMKKRLEDKDFIINEISNTEEKPILYSGIYQISNKKASDVTQALQSELHVPIKESPPKNVQATSTTDILIILGNDIKE